MTIATCPKCHEQVSVPAGVRTLAKVRCPLCHEEYPLVAALERLPPLLLVVVEPTADESPAATNRSIEPPAVFERDSFFEDDSEYVPDSEFDADSQSDRDRHTEQEAQRGDAGEAVIEVEEFAENESVQTGVTSGWAVHEPAVRPAAGRDPNHTASRAPVSSIPTRTRSRRKQAGPVRSFVQVVGGGILGLAIAQLILWWLPGSWKANRDPLGLADDVAKYAPFLVPAQLKASSATAQKSTARPSSTVPQTVKKPTGSDSSPAARQARQPDELIPNPALSTDSLDNEPMATEPPTTPTDPADASKDEPSSEKERDSESAKTQSATQSDPFAPTGTTRIAPKDEAPSNQATSTVTPASGEGDEPTAVATDIKRIPPVSEPGAPKMPRVDANQLVQQLSDAVRAEDAWDTGTTASRDERRQLLIDFYSGFAKIGESMVFLDRNDPQTADSVRQVQQAIEDLAKDPEKLGLIGAYSARWLDQEQEHSGVALYGTIVASQPQGRLFEIKIKLPLPGDRVVTVVSPANLAEASPPNARILILGAIVSDPAQLIEDYEGDSVPMIFAGYHLALPGE